MSKQQTYWLTGVIALMLALAATIVLYMQLRPEKVVTNFEECRDVGGAIMESYPERCLHDGVSYVNANRRPSVSSDEYIGLREDAAMAQAENERTIARVVERDGEMLPVTMDFVYGRHNFYIKDGRVYKVEIEGEANDSPMPIE